MSDQVKKQQRSKETLPAIKDLITLRATKEPDKNRNVLAEELLEEIKEKFPKEFPPAIETIIKSISKARNPDYDPLGEQWHMGTLAKNPISPEAIPYILRMRLRSQTTIRQAIWISRLCKVISDLETLENISFEYAFHERVSEISGTNFDTTSYDSLLVDSKSQKELLKRLRNLEENVDWPLRKKVRRQALHPINEGSRFVRFTDTEVFGVGKNEPDFSIGTRESFIKAFTEKGVFKKNTVFPESEFTLRLPGNMYVVKHDDQLPLKEDKK